MEAVVFVESGQVLLGDVESGLSRPAASGCTPAPRPRKLHPDLIDLPARNELEEREGHQRDTEKGRNHEEESSDDIIPKRISP